MLQTYAKLVNGELQYAPLNHGPYLNYNANPALLEKDGWKILIRHDDMEQRQTERLHHFDYTEDDKYIIETMIYDETIDECRQRLDYEKAHALKLSVVDFEGGLYEVFGKDFNDICELASGRYADKIDPKKLRIALKAQEFSRIDECVDNIALILGIAPRAMTLFFETKDCDQLRKRDFV